MRFFRRSRPTPVPESARIEALVEDRDALAAEARATASALLRVSSELSDLKDVVAEHIVTAGRAGAGVDAQSMAASLLQAFKARGVDLRIELVRSEGARP
jgi:hypothetical protein